METIAFYRESIIKTYGFFERTGLCLVTVDLPFHQIGDWGEGLSGLPDQFGVSLILLMARPASGNLLRIHMILDESQTGPLLMNTPQPFFATVRDRLKIEREVELLYFQGPHYGDRYGIASAALTALSAYNVPVLAVTCTGASVFLVTPKGKTPLAREALGQAFMTPESEKHGRP
ncbi:MAG: hypothetical protein HY787_16980 [Deltaproteobacteria bacterium]|nr:hypothetical protein [Deltaproteobacteria bacterium]